MYVVIQITTLSMSGIAAPILVQTIVLLLSIQCTMRIANAMYMYVTSSS